MTERDEDEVALSTAFGVVHDAINYEYDFGASWRVQIHCIDLKHKTVRKSQFEPTVKVIGGRGPTIEEYGGGQGTAYNKKALNAVMAEMDEFVFYPWTQREEEAESAEEGHSEDPLQHSNSSVLGKRSGYHVDEFEDHEPRRKRRRI